MGNLNNSIFVMRLNLLLISDKEVSRPRLLHWYMLPNEETIPVLYGLFPNINTSHLFHEASITIVAKK